MRQEEEDPRSIISYSSSIPWSNVKLVHAVRDRTGSFVDVIVDRVKLLPSGGEKKTSGTVKDWKRIIPGLESEVPWPVKDEPEEKDQEYDTLRITVEEETHKPYLLRPPMPGSVIYELRNEHSRFTNRPDPKKVARREAWAAEAARKKHLSRSMSTPMMELQEKNRAERAAKVLSEETLAKIGEFMTRQNTGSTAGLSQKEA